MNQTERGGGGDGVGWEDEEVMGAKEEQRPGRAWWRDQRDAPGSFSSSAAKVMRFTQGSPTERGGGHTEKDTGRERETPREKVRRDRETATEKGKGGGGGL